MKEFMIRKREARGVSVRWMAKRIGISYKLLIALEENYREITSPRIALRISSEYGLNYEETSKLVHEDRHEKLKELWEESQSE